MNSAFDEATTELLCRDLPQELVSHRKSGSKTLSYLEGHTAIDQGNRVFGYGNWSYRALSCEMVTIIDPLTGEALGVTYKAKVELTVRDAEGPIIEVGSHPVAAWNVLEVVAGRRQVDELSMEDVTQAEKRSAQRTIVDAHENAEKSSVTDALKRCMKAYGSQFGNGLYGKFGSILLIDDLVARAEKLLPELTWEQVKAKVFKGIIPDERMTPDHCKQMGKALDNFEKKKAA